MSFFKLPQKDKTPSPCFVLEESALQKNLEIIDRVQKESGAEVLLALKGFAFYRVFGLVRNTVGGVTASSFNEAELARRYFKGEIHTYAPVYVQKEAIRFFKRGSHITFNSLSQYQRFYPAIKRIQKQRAVLRAIASFFRLKLKKTTFEGPSIGLRINPEYSEVETDLYNPCIPGSRLGIRKEILNGVLPEGVEGLHSHNLCESPATATAATIASIEKLYGPLLPKIKWINLGGGHLMTRKGYDLDLLIDSIKKLKQKYPHLTVYLEPGSAFGWQTGYLKTTVEDIVDNCGIQTAILDISFSNHLPDCLEMPYKPAVRGELPAIEVNARKALGKEVYGYRLGGCSCLAGDFIPDFYFDEPLKVGQTLIFEDAIHYTLVKTTHFNGVNLPSIAVIGLDGKTTVLKRFGFKDYRRQL